MLGEFLRDPWKFISLAQCTCGNKEGGPLREQSDFNIQVYGGRDKNGSSCRPAAFAKDPWQEEVNAPPPDQDHSFGLPQGALQAAPQGSPETGRGPGKSQSHGSPLRPHGGAEQEDEDFETADLADTAEFASRGPGQDSRTEQATPNRTKSTLASPPVERARPATDRARTRLFQAALGGGESESEEDVPGGPPGVLSMQWHGRCGFVVRLRPDTPSGPWMCHHFTLDGTHCVRFGLGKQHANRCAGMLHPIAEADSAAADGFSFGGGCSAPRCMGLRKPEGGSMGYPMLVRCGRPATAPVCRPDTCPYIAQNLMCPYAARAVEAATGGGLGGGGLSIADSTSCTTAPLSEEGPNVGGAAPEADSDLSPVQTPRTHARTGELLTPSGPVMRMASRGEGTGGEASADVNSSKFI
eukprot:TRINITY_DN38592_c0_g1_i2.p1 TRINITY_DN38592_c0_g1~~TRINITY_DN38592_c0_g1_i2.p1  ORF type:complete len:412 (-),score=59.34 TRINITY_DN38592_c0_g1_i2:144-1379(-)